METAQTGVLVGQAWGVLVNAPPLHVLRSKPSAHCVTGEPQALPSVAQVLRPVVPTHSFVFGAHGRHLPRTQAGALVGQGEVPLNAPLTQALRLPVSAHCDTVGPQLLPFPAQV